MISFWVFECNCKSFRALLSWLWLWRVFDMLNWLLLPLHNIVCVKSWSYFQYCRHSEESYIELSIFLAADVVVIIIGWRWTHKTQHSRENCKKGKPRNENELKAEVSFFYLAPYYSTLLCYGTPVSQRELLRRRIHNNNKQA